MKSLDVLEKLPDSYPILTRIVIALQVALPLLTKPVTSYPATDYGHIDAPRTLSRILDAWLCP